MDAAVCDRTSAPVPTRTSGPDARGRGDHSLSKGSRSGRGDALRRELTAQLVERAPQQAADLHGAQTHRVGDLGLRHVPAETELDETLVAGRQPFEGGADHDALVERRVGPRVAAGVEQVEHRTPAVGGRRVERGGTQVARRDLCLLDGLEAEVELMGELARVRVVAELLLEPGPGVGDELAALLQLPWGPHEPPVVAEVATQLAGD